MVKTWSNRSSSGGHYAVLQRMVSPMVNLVMVPCDITAVYTLKKLPAASHMPGILERDLSLASNVATVVGGGAVLL